MTHEWDLDFDSSTEAHDFLHHHVAGPVQKGHGHSVTLTLTPEANREHVKWALERLGIDRQHVVEVGENQVTVSGRDNLKHLAHAHFEFTGSSNYVAVRSPA